MADASLDIQKAYYDLLNGTVFYNAVAVPVFDRVPNNQVFPYIWITSQTFGEQFGVCNSERHTIVIQVVTGFDGDYGGKMEASIISKDIYTLVAAAPLILTPDFKDVIHKSLEGSFFIEESTDSHYIVRKVLKFRHLIHVF